MRFPGRWGDGEMGGWGVGLSLRFFSFTRFREFLS
jgi:hypothetical protein